ncbi:MAG: sensor histidine kinase [Roseiflexaceae bacterium]|nr:sensor histidine kinase [Roseiflexaceae bacterium]
MRAVPQIEPGVLALFRLFTGVMWLVLSLRLLGVRPRFGPDQFTVIMWCVTGVLLVYLCWGWLRQRLGPRYLPIALVVATLTPILAHATGTASSRPVVALVTDPAQLYFWLIPPLLFTSAQYGLRAVALFTGTTALLPLLLALPATTGRVDTLGALGHAGARLMLFALIGFMVVRLNTAQRTQRRELADKHVELAKYAVTQEQLAISRERNRMARELHDTLAHTLSAISVQLSVLDVQIGSDQGAARHTLQQTHDLTRTGLHEARRALQTLRASPIEEFGLAQALRQLAERSAHQAGLQLSLDIRPLPHALAPELEQQIYRIGEEALQNVVRHANASALAVRLSTTTGGMELAVDDNGRGFDMAVAAANGHYGLIGMRERAALAQGTLTIRSQPGGGTRVSFTSNPDSA